MRKINQIDRSTFYGWVNSDKSHFRWVSELKNKSVNDDKNSKINE
ncbi:MAG: hypothetical protein HeimC3_33810 [Candidatus Heimdallarchaeota archaeon LC_3]|nr:MAG: hypothetical protein HeimC3_33810 [Candidatus Heimdallarchaeota archaeon LC_3]